MTSAILGRAKAHGVLQVCSFGSALVPYGEGLPLQQRLAGLCKERVIPDTVLLLQHAPVYTLGKRGSSKDFLTPPEQLRAEGAEVFSADRGGEVTFHGPGQVVMYPIINLRRLGVGARVYVEGLEDVMVRTAALYGVSAQGRVPGRTGVWVGERKLGAVGVRISHGVATHGVALNVATDLRRFAPIVACGLADVVPTSLQQELAVVAGPGAARLAPPSSLGGAPILGSAGLFGQAEAAQSLLRVRGVAGGALGDGKGGSEQPAEPGELGNAGVPGANASVVEIVAAQLADAFAKHFGYSVQERISPPELEELLDAALEPRTNEE